jgi:hypothetical protein
MSNLNSQQLPSELENEEKSVIIPPDLFTSFSQVESGLEFILKHLSGPQFPRSIMVPTRRGQKEMGYKDLAMLYYQGALWEDCRISAFYPGQKNPDLVFVDIDLKGFKSERALKSALTKILKRIRKKIGGHPTVLWSGRGYHIIQPIDCHVDLDKVDKFIPLVWDKEVNKAFLQFAAEYLSNDKKDGSNNTSLKSCLLRIPGSHNSKCKAEGKDPEVKIMQEWDGFRPDVKLMLGSFHSYLVAKKLEEDQKREKYSNHSLDTQNGQVTYWIEKLIDTPLDDFRQIARDLIIIPYLIVRKGMTDVNEIEAIVMRWADKCNELEPLRPSYREFERDMRYRIRVVMRDMIPPKSFDTLQEENPALAQKLRTS